MLWQPAMFKNGKVRVRVLDVDHDTRTAEIVMLEDHAPYAKGNTRNVHFAELTELHIN